MEKPDNDAGDSKNDQQDARPGTPDNALAVQYPENRGANQQKNGDTNDDEAPLLQLLALPCFTLLLILLLRRHTLFPSRPNSPFLGGTNPVKVLTVDILSFPHVSIRLLLKGL